MPKITVADIESQIQAALGDLSENHQVNVKDVPREELPDRLLRFATLADTTPTLSTKFIDLWNLFKTLGAARAQDTLRITAANDSTPFEKLQQLFPTIQPDRFIDSVLVANNGMAAAKIIKDLRDYAQRYMGDRYAIRIVVMATKDDIRNRMAFLNDADEIEIIEPPFGVQPYAIVDLIADVAERRKVSAVHPGWGWASELASLPEALQKKKIRYLGPDGASVRLLGSKAAANVLFESVDASGAMPRWTGTGHTIDVTQGESITPEIIEKVTVKDRQGAREAAKEVGFPVMAKISDAGGGRGMHIFWNAEDFDAPPAGSFQKDIWAELASVASLNDSNIFVMQLALQQEDVVDLDGAKQTAHDFGYPVYLRLDNKVSPLRNENELEAKLTELNNKLASFRGAGDTESKIEILGGGQRHIEVQLLMDAQGNAIALWPRDCSGQRNNQKVSEEAAAIDPEVAKKIMRSAVAVGRAAGYKSAATVEFLIDPKTNKLTFLEVNTRVQVEHPVTEGTTDIGIFGVQMLVEQGVPLHEIPTIRAYYFGANQADNPEITMEGIEKRMLQKAPEGHTIALRITAEDPHTFTFSPGKIYYQNFQGDRHSWFYGAYESGGEVSPNADSQIGHLFVWGATREQAIANARVALGNLKIFGTLKTNIPFLKWLLNQDEFIQYEIHNRLYERWQSEGAFKFEEPKEDLTILASIAVRAFEASRDTTQVQADGKVGDYRLILNNQWQHFDAYLTGPHTLALVNRLVPTNIIEVKVHKKNAVDYEVIVDGHRSNVLASTNGGTHQKMSINGVDIEVALGQVDPSRLQAPMSGRILAINIKRGDRVQPGQIVMKLWANKTEQDIRTLVAGLVENIEVAFGDTVGQGTALALFAGVAAPTPLENNRQPLLITAPAWLSGDIEQNPSVFQDVLHHILDNYAYPMTPEALLKGFDHYLDYLISQKRWADVVAQFMWANRPFMPEPLFEDIENFLNEVASDARVKADHQSLVRRIDDIVSSHYEGLRAKKELSDGKNDFVALLDVFLGRVTSWIEVAEKSLKENNGQLPQALRNQLQDYIQSKRPMARSVVDYRELNAGLMGLLDDFNSQKVLSESELQAVKKFKDSLAVLDNLNLLQPIQHLANTFFAQYFVAEMTLQAKGLTNPQTFSLAQKNALAIRLLTRFNELGGDWTKIGFQVGDSHKTLRSLLDLRSPVYNGLLTQIERLVMKYTGATFEERLEKMRAELNRIKGLSGTSRIEAMDALVSETQSIFDLLMPLMLKADDDEIKRLARSIYFGRTYRGYESSFNTRAQVMGRILNYNYPGEAGSTRAVFLEAVSSMDALSSRLGEILTSYGDIKSSDIIDGNHVLKILVNAEVTFATLNERSQTILTELNRHLAQIQNLGIKRIVVSVLNREGDYPMHYNYRVPPLSTWTDAPLLSERIQSMDAPNTSSKIQEDLVYRGLEPTLAYMQLDFDLLKNFAIRAVNTPDNSIYIYEAIDKESLILINTKKAALAAETNAANKRKIEGEIKKLQFKADTRLFARTMVRNLGEYTDRRFTGIDDAFSRSLTNLRIAQRENPRVFNEIYINVLQSFSHEALTPNTALQYVDRLLSEQRDHLNQLKVQKVEFKGVINRTDGIEKTYRVIALSKGGAWQDITFYEERLHEGKIELIPLVHADKEAPKMAKVETGRVELKPYPVLNEIDRRRKTAENLGTTYAYDWPDKFLTVLEEQWVAAGKSVPDRVLVAREFYLGANDQLLERIPKPGANIDTQPESPNAAVAFGLTLKTPEYPKGRELMVVINNDVNVDRGPYGPREANLFERVTRRAIQEGVPLLNIQSNMGAQFDIDDLLVDNFHFAPRLVDATKGFVPKNVGIEYVYFTKEFWEANESRINKGYQVEPITVGDEIRYKITAAPTLVEGIDADSLNYSGLMAGIADEAFEKIVTYEYTNGNGATQTGSIGIGSYKARLLRRVYLLNGVLEKGFLILTGHRVLNASFAKDERTGLNSNLDTGGPDIMLENGVAFWGPVDDLDFARRFLRGLTYIPKDNRSLPPMHPSADLVSRNPRRPETPAEKRDTLFLIRELADEGFDPDRDIILADHARLVVGANIHIGGIPVGLIAPQLDQEATAKIIPADKLVGGSVDKTEKPPPRVLNSDASFKIAELVDVFNREGRPIAMFVDWQGFSAGTTEMSNEVLKYGAMIVTALRKAKVPVIVYLPPNAELRGGSWVVFDRNINREGRIFMAADTTGRGGVLQYEQVITIKGTSRIPKIVARLMADYPSKIGEYWQNLPSEKKSAIEATLQGLAAHDAEIQEVCLELMRVHLVAEMKKMVGESGVHPESFRPEFHQIKEGVFEALESLQKRDDALRDDKSQKIEFDPANNEHVLAVLSVLRQHKEAWDSLLTAAVKTKFEEARAANEKPQEVMVELAQTALKLIIELQQTAEAMALKGTIDKVIPWEDSRQEFFAHFARELSVLDFERAILKEVPTIKPNQLKAHLAAYRDFIRTKYQEPTQWQDKKFLKKLAKKQAELMQTIVQSKHARAIDAALKHDPGAVIAGLEHYLGRSDLFLEAGVGSSELNTALQTLRRLAAKYPHDESDEKSYTEILSIASDLGLYRGLDADEETPEFYDETGNVFLIRHAPNHPKTLVLSLQSGDFDMALWQKLLEVYPISSINSLVFLDTQGKPVFAFKKEKGQFVSKPVDSAKTNTGAARSGGTKDTSPLSPVIDSTGASTTSPDSKDPKMSLHGFNPLGEGAALVFSGFPTEGIINETTRFFEDVQTARKRDALPDWAAGLAANDNDYKRPKLEIVKPKPKIIFTQAEPSIVAHDSLSPLNPNLSLVNANLSMGANLGWLNSAVFTSMPTMPVPFR